MSSIKNKEGFVINSFNSDSNYLVEGLKDSKINEFEFFENTVTPYITLKETYIQVCSGLIDKVNTGEFKKIILSRIKKEPLSIHPIDIYKRLNDLYKNTFNYLISIENVGCWLGATPETLIKIDSDVLKTESIAGTKVGDTMSWGTKEIEEQKIVTDFIYKTLKGNTTEISTKGPFTFKTGAGIQHLKTEFECDIKDIDWTKITKQLHPTPATCGLPKESTQNHINQIEFHNRHFYTGFLGLITKESKYLFVNLRCMEIQNNNAYLYLGGGITGKSIPIDEWNETENKAKTLLRAISLSST